MCVRGFVHLWDYVTCVMSCGIRNTCGQDFACYQHSLLQD